MSAAPLLDVSGLTVGFRTEKADIRVIEDVSFSLRRGETLGLIGESGCGKSVTAQTLMRLLPPSTSFIAGGKAVFDDTDLVATSPKQMQKIRGDRIGMIFQEPMTSLNPTMTIGAQIAEVLLLHRRQSYREAVPLVVETLKLVGIGNAERRLTQYPHELSGGLRQRVMIAMAIVCKPDLLIADEPTTALDVTIQAQIMELLQKLQKDLGLAILLITHDLGVVANLCHRVAVMYAGRIVETGATADVMHRPRHPYTAGLLASSPRHAVKGAKLASIPGLVPPPGARGLGCSFASRCAKVSDKCSVTPPLVTAGASAVACWNPVSSYAA
jgi:oligopeptide/dipeptide ABC transporter ATP-binding protein